MLICLHVAHISLEPLHLICFTLVMCVVQGPRKCSVGFGQTICSIGINFDKTDGTPHVSSSWCVMSRPSQNFEYSQWSSGGSAPGFCWTVLYSFRKKVASSITTGQANSPFQSHFKASFMRKALVLLWFLLVCIYSSLPPPRPLHPILTHIFYQWTFSFILKRHFHSRHLNLS